MKSTQNPERATGRLVRGLGVASLGLGVPMLLRPGSVARLAGVDDSASAPGVIRAVGARELVHAAACLVGPQRSVWTRVAGDALDLALLGHTMKTRRAERTGLRGWGKRGQGERLTRVNLATAAVAGIAAVDLYAAVRTARAQHGKGRPGPLSLEASTTVNRPPDEVFAFWRDLGNLPSFMLHLESVTTQGDGTSHWVAKGPAGKKVSWDAEITSQETGRRLAWRSLKGATVANSGTVHFAPAPGDRGTEVRVVLHYDVPGGRVGRAVARLFGEEPEQQVRDDLRRFKQVMETGSVVRTEILPHGTEAKRQFLQGPAQPNDKQPNEHASNEGSSR
ncbi:SRPBCC family protein [Nocardioides campestrisoli]|uniref:SRPBCC family protein n=1 Tax=Nocardioides campestrisoli TaxID=2736757 RepID=UPI0015E69922|nr:SRPBCC family protein [Nocardioides campestrisoli]